MNRHATETLRDALLSSVDQLSAVEARSVVGEDFKRSLAHLERRGLVARAKLVVRRVDVAHNGPVFSSLSGAKPDAQALARTVRDRYSARTPEVMDVWSSAFRKPSTDHELGVAGAWAWWRRHYPGWEFHREEQRRGARVPDATAVSPSGLSVAIEFIAEYRSPKIHAIATWYAERNIPYVLF